VCECSSKREKARSKFLEVETLLPLGISRSKVNGNRTTKQFIENMLLFRWPYQNIIFA